METPYEREGRISPGEGQRVPVPPRSPNTYTFKRGATGNKKAMELADKFTATARLHNALESSPKLSYTTLRKTYASSKKQQNASDTMNDAAIKKAVEKQWKPYTSMKVDEEMKRGMVDHTSLRKEKAEAKSNVYALEALSTQIIAKKPEAHKLMEGSGDKTRMFTSDRLQRLHEKRLAQHNKTIETYRLFRRDIDKELQQRVEEISVLYKKRFEDKLYSMQKLLSSLSDEELVKMNMDTIDSVWTDLAAQFHERKEWINCLQGELFDVEDERLDTVSSELKDLVRSLGEIGKAMPGEIERLLHKEAHAVNVAVIRNRTSYQELSARMKLDEIDKQDDMRKKWCDRKLAWRSLRHDLAIREYHEAMSQDEFTFPPQVRSICDQLMGKHNQMRERVLSMLSEKVFSMKPPGNVCLKDTKQLILDLQAIRIDSDDQSIVCVKQLRDLEESVHSKALSVYQSLEKRLNHIAAKNGEEIHEEIERDCLPTVETRHAASEEQTKRIDEILKVEDQEFHLKSKGVGLFSVQLSSEWESFIKALNKLHDDVQESLDVRADDYADQVAGLEGQLFDLLLNVRNAPTKQHIDEALAVVQNLLGSGGAIEESHRSYNRDSVAIVKAHKPKLNQLFEEYTNRIMSIFGLEADFRSEEEIAAEAEAARLKAEEEEKLAKKANKAAGKKKDKKKEEEPEEVEAEKEPEPVYTQVLGQRFRVVRDLDQVISEMIENVHDEEAVEDDEETDKQGTETGDDADAVAAEQDPLPTESSPEKETAASKSKKGKETTSAKQETTNDEEQNEEEEDAKEEEEESDNTPRDKDGKAFVEAHTFERSLLSEQLPILRDSFLSCLLEMQKEENDKVDAISAQRSESLSKEIDITLRKHHPRMSHIESMVYEVRETELRENARRFQRHVQRLRATVAASEKKFENNTKTANDRHIVLKTSVEKLSEQIPAATNLAALQNTFKSGTSKLREMGLQINTYNTETSQMSESVMAQCQQMQDQFIEMCEQNTITEETDCSQEVKALLQYRGKKKKKGKKQKKSRSTHRSSKIGSSNGSVAATSTYTASRYGDATTAVAASTAAPQSTVYSTVHGDDDAAAEGSHAENGGQAYRYHKEEVAIYAREISMLMALPQSTHEKQMKEIASLIESLENERQELKTDFEGKYATMQQNLAVNLGLGQKYGAPKRNLTTSVREEFVRSERMGGSIDQRLVALEKLLQSHPGQTPSVRIPSRALSASGGSGEHGGRHRRSGSTQSSSTKSSDSLETDEERKTRLAEEKSQAAIKAESRSVSGQVLTVLDSMRTALYRRAIYLDCITPGIKQQTQIIPLQVQFNPEEHAQSISFSDLERGFSGVATTSEDVAINEKLEASIRPLMTVVHEAKEKCRTDMATLTKELRSTNSEVVIDGDVPKVIEEHCASEVQKASQRRLSDIEGLRRQVETVVALMPSISEIVMEDVLARSKTDFSVTFKELQEAFESSLSGWKEKRSGHRGQLKPAIAHDIVEEINTAEESRVAEARAGVELFRMNALEAMDSAAKKFLVRLVHITNLLVTMYDTCLHEQDLAPPEGGRPPSKHKSIKHLIRERNRKLAEGNGENDDSAAASSGKKGKKDAGKKPSSAKGKKGKATVEESVEESKNRYRTATWSGIKTATFVIPTLRDAASASKADEEAKEENNAGKKGGKKKDKKGDKTSKSDTTGAEAEEAAAGLSPLVKGYRNAMNRTVITARNAVYDEFTQYFESRIESVVSSADALLDEEARMHNKWKLTVESIRAEI